MNKQNARMCLLYVVIISLILIIFMQDNEIVRLKRELEIQSIISESPHAVISDTIQAYDFNQKPLRAEVSRSKERSTYTNEELKLMAMLVHAEAESESHDGKILVARVVMNRQNVGGWFGSTIKEVIYKPGQFYGIKRQCFVSGEYTDEDMKSVIQAENDPNKYLYFANLNISTDLKFIKSMNWEIRIGDHWFSN